MLNRMLALSCLSVGLYGAYLAGILTHLGFGEFQGNNHQGYHTELLAQEAPSNSPPHRGSGRCDQAC